MVFDNHNLFPYTSCKTGLVDADTHFTSRKLIFSDNTVFASWRVSSSADVASMSGRSRLARV